MVTSTRRNLLWFVAILLSLGASSWAIASGVTSDSAKKRARIYACVPKVKPKTMVLSRAGASCPRGQRKISWNAKGPRGAQGPVGPVGPDGATGPEGATGPQGATGPGGATGPQGVPGPAGASAPADYAYIYNLTPQTVAIGADVLFDTNGVISGFVHAPGSPSITVGETGIYEISFIVSGTEPNQFAIFANGVPVAGSIYGSGAGTQQTSGQMILALAAGDILTLRNHSSAAAVTLSSMTGGTEANVNASITIQRLPE